MSCGQHQYDSDAVGLHPFVLSLSQDERMEANYQVRGGGIRIAAYADEGE